MKSNHEILVLGANIKGLQAALSLAHFGRRVVLIDKNAEIEKPIRKGKENLNRWTRYLLAQVSYHPSIQVMTETEVADMRAGAKGLEVALCQKPHWVLPDLCVDCEKCLAACPVEFSKGDKPLYHLSFPNSMAIDKRMKAPCRSACPIGMNPQGYIALIAKGRFEEAYDLILESNPLPGICGRICHHPCEGVCRRQEVDESLAICSLKRFASDEARKTRTENGRKAPVSQRGPRVAVIGSGPSGLTSAHELINAGFRPTLFEAEDRPGGLMAHAIAPFRLPRETLNLEIDDILSLGVELRLNSPVKTYKDIKRLKKEGFKAIILATGASEDLRLNVTGEELQGILGCVSFLKTLWNGNGCPPMGRVIIIGGGNAAVEAARASIRVGADDVSLVCLEQRHEMPAWEYETQEAVSEGVHIINGFGPKRLYGKDGILEGIELKRCISVFDKMGAFNPQYDESDITAMEVETAIIAIGQTRSLSMFGESEISVTEDGLTNIDGIYAAGDMIKGPSTVVEAMASGRKAARNVIRDLEPSMAERFQMEDSPELDDYRPIPKDMPKQARGQVPRRQAKERILDHGEVVGSFSSELAIEEASRCLQCGVCSECLRCEATCDLSAIRHSSTSQRDSYYFDRIIVADEKQIESVPSSPKVHYMSEFSKTDSLPGHIISGRGAALDCISNIPALKEQFSTEKSLGIGELKTGVFICSCNGTLNEYGQLEEIVPLLSRFPNVVHTEILLSACHPQEGLKIEELIGSRELDSALIASCTCCHLDFVCESCNDQRIRLKHRLFREFGYSPQDIAMINIKETCLLPFKKDPKRAVDLASRFIRAGLVQLKVDKERFIEKEVFNPRVLFLGATEAGINAAKEFVTRSSPVLLVENRKIKKDFKKEIEKYGIDLLQPVRLVRLDGQRGAFSLIVEDQQGPVRRKKDSEGPLHGGGKRITFMDPKLFDDDHRYRRISAGTVIIGKTEFKEIPYQRDPFLREMPRKIKQAFGNLETGIPGVYLASWRQSKNLSEQALGKAVASRSLESHLGKTHPFNGPVADVDPELCRGCGRCAEACPEGAARLYEEIRGVASSRVDPGFCSGCGSCIAECPTSAIRMPESDQTYFERVMDAFLG